MRNRVLQAMLVGLAGLAISSTAYAEFGDELFTLTPLLMDSDERIPTPGMEFGGAAAVQGNFALVAAEEDAFFGNSTGSVWLIDVQSGNSIAVLDPLDLAPEDGLGESVAIDGSIGVMSADAKDNDRGAAYIFDLSDEANCEN